LSVSWPCEIFTVWIDLLYLSGFSQKFIKLLHSDLQILFPSFFRFGFASYLLLSVKFFPSKFALKFGVRKSPPGEMQLSVHRFLTIFGACQISPFVKVPIGTIYFSVNFTV